MSVHRLPSARTSASAQAAPFVVASARMASLLALAERAAASDGRVLVTGESGVGKQFIARHIHQHSARRRRAFVSVNCSAFTESRFESDLFGHVKGSFAGAHHDKPGKLRAADRGTLFFDEIGELSLHMQALLLRFLETGEIQPIGAAGPAAVADVRIIAATSRNLPEMVSGGAFREDLLYRIRVIHLDVPPLRERAEDIRVLVRHFTEQIGRPTSFTENALRTLEQYRWPGNVRELQNVVEQAVWLAGDGVVDAEQLPITVRVAQPSAAPIRERRMQVADELYDALVNRGYSFWEHIHPLFLSRDITRHDMRELVRRGLTATHGSYRRLIRQFGIPSRDYKRFLNFLAAHDCRADFREFRNGTPEATPAARLVLPPLAPSRAPGAGETRRDPR